MRVARAAGGVNAIAIKRGGFFKPSKFLKRLAAVKIAGTIIGVVGEQRAELRHPAFQVATVDVIHRERVAHEGILGILSKHGAEGFSARGHYLFIVEGMTQETKGRPVSESRSEMSEFALPNDANMLGTLFGGKVMSLVDLAGALAAVRHARCPVVTASVDHMTFLHPIHIGNLVILRSQVNRVFRTSMEVGVKVSVENLRTREIKHTSSAYLTFVAIDKDGNRVPIDPVIPESEEELRRYNAAGVRREHRLAMKAAGK